MIVVPLVTVGGCCILMSQLDPKRIDSKIGNRVTQREPSNTQTSIIPGIEATDVYLNLVDLGFSMKKDLRPDNCCWLCEKSNGTTEIDVEITGKSNMQIDSVQAVFYNYTFDESQTVELASDMMSYIATIPYDSSRPEEARAWVRNNLGRDARTTIGPVSFLLVSTRNAPRVVCMYVYPEGDSHLYSFESSESGESPGLRRGNSPVADTVRTWTAKSGHTTEAIYAGFEPGHVFLKKVDGTLVKVRLSDLIERDRRFAVATARERGELKSSRD